MLAVRVGFEPYGVVDKSQVIDYTNSEHAQNASKHCLITNLLRIRSTQPTPKPATSSLGKRSYIVYRRGYCFLRHQAAHGISPVFAQHPRMESQRSHGKPCYWRRREFFLCQPTNLAANRSATVRPVGHSFSLCYAWLPDKTPPVRTPRKASRKRAQYREVHAVATNFVQRTKQPFRGIFAYQHAFL